MNYQETIDWLFSRLPMFSRIGAAAFKKDLTNTVMLCRYLGNPQDQFPAVHIAGTNGKGSVSHMLASIFQTAGYKTGLYTSPHLKDFRERIKMNGQMIPEEAVIAFTDKIRTLAEEIEPSFFEITVAMAFDHFAKEKVDIAIIETGLGGRFDSTNIIHPVLSVITNIGWDHMNILGDSLGQIAFEKAGIIKPSTPIVIGEEGAESTPVFEKVAREKNAPIFFADKIRHVVDWKWEKHEFVVEISEDHNTDHKIFRLDLPGIYQAKNLLTVLECCRQLHHLGWKLDDENLKKGLSQAKKITGLHGRWEIIHPSPLLVLDVAHNEDGIRQLLQQVELIVHRQLHIVFGLVRDKEVDKIISMLPKHARYYFTRSAIPRAMPEDQLAAIAAEQGLEGHTYPEVNEAIRAALTQAHADDLILVCGSVFLVGEVQQNKSYG